MTPGEQLRAWIRAKGWTVLRFAVEVGVSETTLYAWMSGRSRPGETRRERVEAMTGIAASSWPVRRNADKHRARKRALYAARKAAGVCVECEDPMERKGACCDACLRYRRGGRDRLTRRRKAAQRAKRRGVPVRRQPSWIETWRELREAS